MLKFPLILSFITLFQVYGDSVQIDLAPLEASLIQRDQYLSVSATVKQEKLLPAFSDALVSEGSLDLIPQQSFRWEQGSPVTDVALYNGERVYLINEKEKTALDYKPKAKEVRPLMLLMGIGEDATYEGLMDNFKPVETSTEGYTYTITLEPDSGLMKRALTQLTLVINLKTCFPEQIVWVQKDGAIITTDFIDTKFDIPLSGNEFLFDDQLYTLND